ncbi:MAG: ABC transporter permease [Candidatus Acidiferrum sp.]
MRRLRAWLSRLGEAFGKKRREQELAAEMESHLQLHVEDNLQAGMSLAQARREAIMKLGGVEQTKENYRERRGLPLLEVFLQDLRFGTRMLRKNPAFTLVAVLTLALGIAANSTIFSFVSAILYTRPPVSDPDRLAVVYGLNPVHMWGPGLSPVSAPNYFTWKRENRVFSDLAASNPYNSVNLTGDGDPERVSAIRVTASYFSLLGAAPELGRIFAAGEDQEGHDRVVVLSHRLWERKFGSDPTLIGRSIRLNGERYTVIGVMPFQFRLMSFLGDLWLPLVLNESEQGTAARQERDLYLFGRLKPGVTLAQTQADIKTLGTLAARNFPETENGWAADTLLLQEYMIRDFNAGPAFVLLLSAVGLVLLIACANISGLMLARATGRGKEMAVRIAIGAGRARLARQLMTEALLIAALGAGVGLAFTFLGERLMQAALSFNDAVKLLDLKIDWRVLCFTSAIAVSSALLFGLAPALKAWSVEVFATLKNESTTVSSGRKKNRLRSALVSSEVALAVVLLSGAGILIQGIVAGMRQNMGFDPQRILTAQITLPASRYKAASAQIQFYRELAERLAFMPGAKSAAIASVLPGAGPGELPFRLRGQENLPVGELAHARYCVVSTHFFEVTGTTIIAGRDFSTADDAQAPSVALVSEKLAKQFFPHGDALGNQIRVDSGDAAASQWRTIVGIVHNVKGWPLRYIDDPEIYEPFEQHPMTEAAVLVRAASDPSTLAPGLREAVWSIDRDQPIGDLITLPEILDNEAAGDKIMGKLMGTFSVLALALSGIGLYGLVAYTVGQRSQEIGIRLALGAGKQNILRLVLLDGLKLALFGVVIGLAGALPLPKLFASLFQDYHITGGWIFLSVPVLITGVAMLACYLPARQASRVDPIVTLRYE